MSSALQTCRKIWQTTTTRAAIVGLVVVVTLVLRTREAFRTPQFLIEDGGIFWLSQYTNGLKRSLFVPYAGSGGPGYLHIVPRLIAAFADWFPYAWQPTVYVWCAATAIGWTGATIASAQLPRALGALLGLCIVLVPHGGEVWPNATNLQWIMATALPVIAVTESPPDLLTRANQLAFALLASFSGPFSLLLAPLWACRLVLPSRRTGFDAALAAAALSGGLATVIVLTPQGVTSPASASHVIHLFLTSFARSVTETFVLLANRVFHDALISKVVVFVSVFPVLVLSCFIGLHKSVRLVCLMFLTCVAAATAWRWRFDGGFLGEYYANERYFYIAMVMLAFSFVTLLFEEKRGLQLSGVCLTALLAAATASRFEKHLVTDFSGEWAAKSQYIGKQQVEIQYYPGWQMVVPSRGAAQRSNDR